MMNICQHCNFPIMPLNVAYAYAGTVCMCVWPQPVIPKTPQLTKSEVHRLAIQMGIFPSQRKPLTDEELDALAIDKNGMPNSHLEFARAIEAAHGIK